ncbi:MAG: hypothetical protein ACR2HS_05515 [Gammaproteobacteria bacterium]
MNSITWHRDYLLATGGCDNSIRLWRKEHNNLYLIWSTHVTLCSIDANIEGAEISDNNAALLVQRGTAKQTLTPQYDTQRQASSSTTPNEARSTQKPTQFNHQIKQERISSSETLAKSLETPNY